MAPPCRVPGLVLLLAVTAGLAGAQPETDPETTAVRLATETLREQLEIDVEAITIDEVTAVDWPNASLGCPEPGRTYAPVVLSGFRVTLAVGDGDTRRTHRVHVAGTRALVCPRRSPTPATR